MNTLSSALNNLETILDKFDTVTFFDFPLCLFKARVRNNLHTIFITAEGRSGITKQIGYKPERIEKRKQIYGDIYKKRIEICKNCEFYEKCGGGLERLFKFVWARRNY